MTGALPSRERLDPGPQPTAGTLGSKGSSRSRTEDLHVVVGKRGGHATVAGRCHNGRLVAASAASVRSRAATGTWFLATDRT
jgi:hypothetical protein